MRGRHPARLAKPPEPDRLRDPDLHRRVLARQTCRDERPEPPPMLLPRHRRPPRRPQLSAQGPIRTPPTRHRNRPPPSCCDDRLRPPSMRPRESRMDTHERRVIEVLTDSKRFVVPIYQRQYAWGEE